MTQRCALQVDNVMSEYNHIVLLMLKKKVGDGKFQMTNLMFQRVKAS